MANYVFTLPAPTNLLIKLFSESDIEPNQPIKWIDFYLHRHYASIIAIIFEVLLFILVDQIVFLFFLYFNYNLAVFVEFGILLTALILIKIDFSCWDCVDDTLEEKNTNEKLQPNLFSEDNLSND